MQPTDRVVDALSVLSVPSPQTRLDRNFPDVRGLPVRSEVTDFSRAVGDCRPYFNTFAARRVLQSFAIARLRLNFLPFTLRIFLIFLHYSMSVCVLGTVSHHLRFAFKRRLPLRHP